LGPCLSTVSRCWPFNFFPPRGLFPGLAPERSVGLQRRFLLVFVLLLVPLPLPPPFPRPSPVATTPNLMMSSPPCLFFWAPILLVPKCNFNVDPPVSFFVFPLFPPESEEMAPPPRIRLAFLFGVHSFLSVHANPLVNFSFNSY